MMKTQRTFSHILLKGQNDTALFNMESDYKKILDITVLKKNQYKVDIIGYAVFENHIHLILNSGTKCEISAIISGIKLLYTRYYNKKYSHTGKIFNKTFNIISFSGAKQLTSRLKYLHQKPKKMGLTNTFNYSYSSYYDYANPDIPSIISRELIYNIFDVNNRYSASNLFKAIHLYEDPDNSLDLDNDIYYKLAMAKSIIKEELNTYNYTYANILKPSRFRTYIINRLHLETSLCNQEIADILGLSRHIVGRTIREYYLNYACAS